MLQGLQIFVSHSVEIAFLTRLLISLQIVIPLASQILVLVGTFTDTQVHSHVSNRREPHREVLYAAAAVSNLCATDAAIVLKTGLLPIFGSF